MAEASFDPTARQWRPPLRPPRLPPPPTNACAEDPRRRLRLGSSFSAAFKAPSASLEPQGAWCCPTATGHQAKKDAPRTSDAPPSKATSAPPAVTRAQESSSVPARTKTQTDRSRPPRALSTLQACAASDTSFPKTSCVLGNWEPPAKPLKRPADFITEAEWSHLPVKKRMANMWREQKRQRRLQSAPAFVVVRLCSGEPVGTDPVALAQMGGLAVMDVDVRPEYLGWSGANVRVWKNRRRREILTSIEHHDYERDGPFKLAANLQAGWFVPEQLFDVDVGTLKGGMFDKGNDLHHLLNSVRKAFPFSKLVVLASPPCRMYSMANTVSDPEDKEEYLRTTCRFLKKLAHTMRTGASDCVMVECSASGQHDAKGRFLPGKEATALLEALNNTPKHLECGRKVEFDVGRVDAADLGAHTTRKRLLFAPVGLREALPRPEEKWRGWGEVVGVCKGSNLRLVGGSWRCKKFAGVWPCDPGPTLTTQPMFRYAHSRSEKRVVLVPLNAVERAKLVGCRADDPRLQKLANVPATLARTVTGITFCAQWYLGVLAAAATFVHVYADKDEAHCRFWEAETQRRALHAAPVPGWAPAWHKVCVKVQQGECSPETGKAMERRLKQKFFLGTI